MLYNFKLRKGYINIFCIFVSRLRWDFYIYVRGIIDIIGGTSNKVGERDISVRHTRALNCAAYCAVSYRLMSHTMSQEAAHGNETLHCMRDLCPAS